VIRTRPPIVTPSDFVPANGDVGFYGTPPIPRPVGLTAANAASLDLVYGADELAVLANVRTRLDELENRLKALGLLP
jgi:hypothetical protein